MSGTWSDNFEVNFEKTKAIVAELKANLSNFGPLLLYLKHIILAHIVATTLIPRKRSLSNVTTHDVFFLYCIIKRYKINWIIWFLDYI